MDMVFLTFPFRNIKICIKMLLDIAILTATERVSGVPKLE